MTFSRWAAVIGAVIWSVGLWIPLADSGTMALFERIFLWSPLVVVPLALDLASTPDRHGKHCLSWRVAKWLQPVAAILLVASLLLPRGLSAGLLALPWLAVAIAIACFGLWRFLPRGLVPFEEICIDAALLYLPIGGTWLVASRTGSPLLGFEEPIALLTAVHFHYAGFAAPLIAGLVGRVLPYEGVLLPTYRVAAASVMLGPALLAIGTTVSPALEVIAAFLLAFGVLTLSLVSLLGIVRTLPPMARPLLIVAAIALPASMALACIYAAGEWLGRPLVTLQTMGLFHGAANAFGFASCGLLALAWAQPVSRAAAPGIPMSRLRARRLFIGRDWFHRQGLAGQGEVLGMVDTLEDLTAPAMAMDRVHPAIRAFYEHTSQHQLLVRATWHAPFRTLGRLYVSLARHVGQLVLPLESNGLQQVTCALSPFTSTIDGRLGTRAYVRTYSDGDRPMYVAAYTVHAHAGIGYMNIALPMLGGNLTSTLRMHVLDDGSPKLGVILTSQRGGDCSGDVGIWFANRLCPIRLPISERLEMWTPDMPSVPATLRDAPTGACAVARHQLYVAGRRLLTMDYFVLGG